MAKPPWKKANPSKKAGRNSRKLSPGQKANAKKAAKKAGRNYPNLVDNMNAAKTKKKSVKKATKRKSTK